MRKSLIFITLFILVMATLLYRKSIVEYYNQSFYYSNKEVTLGEKNAYYRDYDFLYVQNTEDFVPNNRQEILNIFYTIINAGKESFTFYCPEEYETCISDVTSIAKDQVALSAINNYVHPFNSFKDISTKTDDSGKIVITITKSYTESEINTVKSVIKNSNVINKNLTTEDQLKAIHDYIINNSIYDSNRTDNNIVNYKSDTAYGTLIEGYGICGGYSDAFQLFLEELHIKNFKVASRSHIWNAVYLYNNWYHYDLTWDDPVTNTNEQVITEDFLKLTTAELHNLEKEQHNFDINYYKEFA